MSQTKLISGPRVFLLVEPVGERAERLCAAACALLDAVGYFELGEKVQRGERSASGVLLQIAARMIARPEGRAVVLETLAGATLREEDGEQIGIDAGTFGLFRRRGRYLEPYSVALEAWAEWGFLFDHAALRAAQAGAAST